MLREPFLVVLFALIVTALTTPVLRRWLVSRQILDWPDDRRNHEHPTPRGGGLAIWLGVVLSLLATSGSALVFVPLVVYFTFLAMLGWLDDCYGVLIGIRLVVMLLCALSLIWILGPVSSVGIDQLDFVGVWLWSMLGVAGVVWMINLHNFMDGSDGLAAMQGSWSGGILGFLLYKGGAIEFGLTGLALAGACLGFLLWNRPPARVFMGDAGSLLLGGIIGSLAYAGAATGLVSVWVSLIVCAVFVVDATATLVVRWLRQGQWYTAHREHAYQRLISSGWSHAGVLLCYGVMNLALVLPLTLLALRRPQWDWAIALVLVGLLGLAWAIVQKGTR
jgi:Fuc2NAc and GlcNAc transferase